MIDTFATTYPTIARFLQTTGTIEIGHHHNFPVTSFIRAFVEDDPVWESADDYPPLTLCWRIWRPIWASGCGKWDSSVGVVYYRKIT
jgi:hypothetical protein